MLRCKLLAIAILVASVCSVSAQKFLPPVNTFSGKKIAYLSMEDGSEMEVFVDKISRKKGLVEEIKAKGTDGKKVKIKPEQIKSMYLPQSGWDKFGQNMEFINDPRQWEDPGAINQDRIKEGYAYFEKSAVMIKKKKITLMMQVLNPGFSNKVKVYHDPYAKETTSWGVGGFTVAGGDAKSYYVGYNGAPAIKLEKKNYDEEFVRMFSKCAAIKEKYPKVKWLDFDSHVFDYTVACD